LAPSAARLGHRDTLTLARPPDQVQAYGEYGEVGTSSDAAAPLDQLTAGVSVDAWPTLETPALNMQALSQSSGRSSGDDDAAVR